MDKSCHSSGGDSTVTSATSSGSSHGDGYLHHLNKISHKISKPLRRPIPPIIEPLQNQSRQNQAPALSQPSNSSQQQQQHQPPVYNINKSDFRDVVQRLTGSPAHERFSNSGSPAGERFSTPSPIQQPKPAISRLQRIRPPPLAQISHRPPSFLSCAAPSLQPPPNPVNPLAAGVAPAAPHGVSSGSFLGGQRQPLSPLPPFPSVHAAAESPISSYMRFLQNSFNSSSSAAADNDPKKYPPSLSPLAPLASPRWNSIAPPLQPALPPQLPPQQQQQNIPPPPTSSSPALSYFPALPSSPLPFGCLPSPGLLSPSFLFSPTGQLGFQQLPSPTLPVLSPRWKGH